MDKNRFQRAFLLILVVVVSLFFLWMIRSFLITLILGAVFASLSFPLYKWVKNKTRGREALSAALTLALLIFVVIIPLLSFMGIVAGQAVKVTKNAKPWVQTQLKNKDDIPRLFEKLPGFKYVQPYAKQITQKLAVVASKLGNFIFESLSDLTKGTVIFFLHLVIMLYAMFFFYIDGVNILKRFLYLMPLADKHEKKIINSFKSMAAATIKGTLVIGLVQGFGAGLALWVAGVPSALFWSAIMVVFSLIPNVGTVIVWGPAVVVMLIKGQFLKAGLVALWCGLVVGSADNVLRPVLVGKDTKMHELMILLSTIGGLVLFGLSGLILGPLVAVLFVTVWDIYGEEFKSVLPKVEAL